MRDDKLVKIFTEQAGKRMFSSNTLVSLSWLRLFSPWCWLVFLRINDDGLSYIGDYHEVMTFPRSIATSLSWPMRPMWQLLQMLVCRTISRMLPCLLFAKDFELMEAGFGLSGFD